MPRRYKPPLTFDILADYGRGYIKVATHTALHQATVQAEHRFMCSAALSVHIRRTDQPGKALLDQDGRALEWTRRA